MRTTAPLALSLLGLAFAALPAAGRDNEKKLLPSLEERCRKILAIQVEVHDGIVKMRRRIEASKGKKITPAQQKAALKLAEKQKAAADEVAKAVEALEKDGSAVAFTEVMRELRKDMLGVYGRLRAGDVGAKTQAGSEDAVGTLNEMLMALTKR